MSYRVRDEKGNVKSVPTSVDRSRDKVDAMAFALDNWRTKRVQELKHEGVDEKMPNPSLQMKTDKCGRYHYAEILVSRVIVLKDGCTEREVITATGTARRQHGDPKDDYVGEGLAISRALEDLGYKLGRRSWGKVKHNDDIKVMRRQQKRRRQEQAQTTTTGKFGRIIEAVAKAGLD